MQKNLFEKNGKKKIYGVPAKSYGHNFGKKKITKILSDKFWENSKGFTATI